MAHNYDDPSNNPYFAGEHGGSGSGTAGPTTSSSSNSNWFCHVCQADFVLTDEQLARYSSSSSSTSPACPSCGGGFVEQIAYVDVPTYMRL